MQNPGGKQDNRTLGLSAGNRLCTEKKLKLASLKIRRRFVQDER